VQTREKGGAAGTRSNLRGKWGTSISTRLVHILATCVALLGVIGGVVFLLLGAVNQGTSNWPDWQTCNWIGAVLLVVGATASAIAVYLSARRLRD